MVSYIYLTDEIKFRMTQQYVSGTAKTGLLEVNDVALKNELKVDVIFYSPRAQLVLFLDLRS